MVVSRHLHAAVEADPRLSAVAARIISDDMAVVGDAHPHPAPVRIDGPRAFDAILVRDESRRVKAEPAIEFLVVEEDQPRGAARRDLDIAFEPVRLIARDQEQRRGIDRRLAARRQHQRAILDARAVAFVGRGLEEIPFRAERQRREIVGQRHAVRPRDRAALGLRDRPRQVAALHTKPAVAGPFDGIEQRLPPERPIAIFIAVIDAPPVARRAFDERGMAARPPFFGGRFGVDERIGGAILPGSVDRLRPRRDDHVAGRRARGAADRGDHVIIIAVAGDLRPFGREAFDHPVGGVAPRVIDMLGLADARQSVVGEADAVAARQEQPARPILADRMAGVDMVGQIEIDRVAPRPLDPVGPDHPARVRTLCWDVEIVAAVMLAEFGRPHRADIAGERGADRAPVHQIARMPDDQARIAVEGREGHIIVGAVLQDRRVGMVARHDRVEEASVAEVGLALAVEAFRPSRRRIGCSGRRAGQRRRSTEARESRPEQPRSGQFEHVAPIGHFSLLAKERPGPRKRRPGPPGRITPCQILNRAPNRKVRP